MRKPWSRDEDAILVKWYGIKRLRSIVDDHLPGRSYQSAISRAKRIGLRSTMTSNGKPARSAFFIDGIFSDYAALSAGKIGKKYGMSRGCVYQIMNRAKRRSA